MSTHKTKPKNRSIGRGSKRAAIALDSAAAKRIVRTLASDHQQRKNFVEDPIAYLKRNSVDISSGRLEAAGLPQTTEATYVAGFYAAVIAIAVAIAWVQWGAWFITSWGGGGGCFLAGTSVRTGTDKSKPIEKISVGDQVLSFDESNQKLRFNRVSHIFRTEQAGYYTLNNSIKTTATHPFWVDGAWKPVKDIKVGDQLLDQDLNPVPVKSIDFCEEPVQVFNLEVDENHTYFVEGMLVHNKEPGLEAGHGDFDLGSPTTLL